MIYQLLRRDPAWKLVPYATAVAGVCMWANSGAVGLSLLATLMIVWPLRALVQRRATLFQAALPISARDLFAARCAAFAALVWLPPLVAAGIAVLKGGSEWKTAAPVLADFGAAATLTLLALLSVRLVELESPPQLAIPQCYLGGAVCAAAFLFLPAAPVLAFCALATVALFVRAWRTLPESFQTAPLEAGRPSKHRANSTPAIPWLILLRSAVPLRNLLFLPLICQNIFLRPANWPAVCVFGIFMSGPLQMSAFWLSALPVARRTLLAIAAATAILAVAIPYSATVAFGLGNHTSLRLALINVVCIMAVCMSELILVVAWGSYRVRRLALWARLGAFIPLAMVVFAAGPALTLISPGHAGRNGLLQAFLLHLSQWPPANPVTILACGALAFAGMFWLLERCDAQAEWPEMLNWRESGQLSFRQN